MLISIITPSFNSANTIERTVASIKSQSYSNVELILVDNESDDETLNIVKTTIKDSHITLKIICEKDEGIADAFNKGIEAASGDIIGILNSDDFYSDDSVFSDVASQFVKDSNVMFVHGDMLFEDSIGGTNVRKPLLCPVDYALPYNHPTMFFRNEVYKKFGLFKKEYQLAMDFEFILRFYKSRSECLLKGIYLPKTLVCMNAGGVSDRLELQSINEVEKALKHHSLWSFRAFVNQSLRRIRIRIKGLLLNIRLGFIIKAWRRFKWS